MTAISDVPHRPATLEGLTALVTGGTRGLGAAVARRLADDGARLVLVGRDAHRTRAAADAIGAIGIAVDLGLARAADELIDRLDAEGVDIDVLVNNAGISGNGPSHELPSERIDELLATNLRTPLVLAARLAARMTRGGAIINVSSALATRGTPGTAVYAATKGGLVSATRALAAEWGPAGVRVNAVEPAITRSDMTSAELADDAIPAYLRHVPLRRIGEPEDIADLVSFLAGPSGAYITGQVIAVDGGWSTTSGPLFPRRAES